MLTTHGVSTRQAATLTGLVRSTAARRHNAATALTPAVCTEPAVEPANKLSDAERRRVLEVLTSDRFVDLAPLQIYAQLLDEGVYLCSGDCKFFGVTPEEEGDHCDRCD
jgi:putative transposase